MPSQQKKYDIIIIGAGLGGLTAGAKLAKDGKKVLLLEQHHKPGGCATTFTRQGYTWDVGLHAMDGLDIDDRKRIIFKELGVFDKVTFVKAPEFYRLKNQRLDIVIPHPAQKAARLLMAKFPAEKQGIEKFFKTIHAIRKESNRIPLQRWKLLLLLPVFPFLFPNIFLYTFKTVGSFLDQEIANEDLKLVLAGNILYYHDDPYTMSFIYFAIAQSGYFEGGSHYIQGGSQRLSEYLAQVIIKNNGKILLSHLATEIITEGRQAVGVRYTDLCDGKKTTFSAYADKIIANTAVPNIVPMLHGKNRGLLKNKIKKLTRPCSLISIYIGFKREVRELKNTNYCTFLLNDKVTTLGEMKNNYRGDFAERSFFFTDYSQIDTKLVPAGRSVASIATADYFEDWQGLSEKEYQKRKMKLLILCCNDLSS